MEYAGKIVGIYGPVVDVRFSGGVTPAAQATVTVRRISGEPVSLKVVEHRQGNICRCAAFSSTFGLRRNSPVEAVQPAFKIPAAAHLFGRVLDALGNPLDMMDAVNSPATLTVTSGAGTLNKLIDSQVGLKFELIETGIKMIDLLFPFVKGSKNGILGGAALGKSVLVLEIIHNVVTREQAMCVFSGVGERIREGQELYKEFVARDLLKRSILIFGQMNESPGARFESAHTAMSLAENIRDDGSDVLFFVDNVFRFAQAGSELSALLGNIPSETGYQPTLSSEIGLLHERIASRDRRSITSVEAVYVPSDDLTDPAVVAIFSHLGSIMTLSRHYVQRGLFPAIDPLQSSSGYLAPEVVGETHSQIAQDVLRHFQLYQELERIVSLIGLEELGREERMMFQRARKLQLFLTQPFFTVQHFTGRTGVYVPLADTLAGCQEIMSGRCDTKGERELYMVGGMESVV